MNANQNETLIEGWISFDSGDYESALKTATSVLETSPNDNAALELKSRATALLSKRKKPPRAALVPVAATLAVALLVLLSILLYRQSANNYYKGVLIEGGLCLDNCYYELALMKATVVLKARPNDEAALELKRRAEGAYELALKKATTVFLPRRNDEAALELKRRVEEEAKFSKLLSEGETSFENGDYESALRNATTVLEARPNDERALELKRRAEDAILWSQSPSREAGFRRTLKIGDAEYGFRWIPAGEFDMGAPETEEKRDSGETLHRVVLTRGFWALETEATQALYREIMGENPSYFEGDNLPVETVSWDEATKFCQELTKRLPKGLRASLPTEAQWEYVGRAGTTTPYSFGSALNGDKANCNGNYPYGTETRGKRVGKTTPVKSYEPNAWGVYDMHGNVWEWQLDYYGEYTSGTVTDPKGPGSASDRVYRGGSWDSLTRDCRSASRKAGSPDARNNRLGFRFILICD